MNAPSVAPAAEAPRQAALRRILKIMRRVILGIIIAVVLYFAVTTALVAIWMDKDEHPKVDAIVVLGAAQYDGRPSAIYAARLEHAVDLYRDGVAPVIVFTGGNEPGDRFTEGGSGARWAVEHGIPQAATLKEETSRTTYENLAGAKKVLDSRLKRGDRPRIVVVSDPFHMFRAMKQADDLGFTAYPSPTRTSPISASHVSLTMAVLREDLALGGYLITKGR
jgi:uncharacterized SAM-binding protein YcdF (DUF218 family)